MTQIIDGIPNISSFSYKLETINKTQKRNIRDFGFDRMSLMYNALCLLELKQKRSFSDKSTKK